MELVLTGLIGLVIGYLATRFGLFPGLSEPVREPDPVPAPPPEPAGRAHAMVAAVLKGLPDPVVLIDRDGSILMSNGRMRELNGAAQPGRHIGSAIRAPGVVEAIERVQAGAATQSVEFSIPGSVERYLEAFVMPVEWVGLEAGAQEYPILVLFHDLTSAKRLEQMRVDFVANASHELRTPLASMAGFIETLRGPAKDDVEAHDKFLKIMDEQATRMGRLINDLLSLSRIELNEHVLPDKEVRIDLLLSDVADALAPVAQDAGVTLSVRGDCIAPVAGDRDELIQVFQNLIDNALNYGASGGDVIVDLACATIDQPGAAGLDVVRVAVKDCGPGIDREHIPRLTERFYRVDVAQSRRQGGTGLGLAIVKHIVMRHRGSLEIQSEKGKGSTFTVSLPRLRERRVRRDPVKTVSVPEPRTTSELASIETIH